MQASALAAGQAAQPLARPRLHPPLLPPALSRLPPVRARAAGRAGWLRALRAAASAADGVNGGGDARNSSGSSSSDGEAQDGRPRTTRRRRRNAEPRQQPEQQQQHGPELDPALQRWLQPAQAVGAPGEAERMPRALRRGRHLAAAMDESEAELMEGYFAHLRQRLALQGAQVRQQLAAVVSPILSNEQSAHGTRAAPQAQPDLLPPHGARERQRRERRRREEYRWRSRTPWYEGPVGDDDAAATVGSHSWDEEGDWQLIVPTASSSSSSGAGGGGSSSSNSSGGGSGGGGQAREREWERGAHAAAWKAAADRHPAALSTMSVDAEDMGAAIAHTFPVDGSLPSAPAPLPSRRTQRRNAQLGGRMINVLVVSAALLNKRNEVLLSYRSTSRGTPEFRGMYEFPGGKVERNETPQVALRRELAEELGVEVELDALQALTFVSHRYRFWSHNFLALLFVVESWRGEPHGAEGQQLKWVGVDDLMGYADKVPEPTKRLLAAVYGVMQHRKRLGGGGQDAGQPGSSAAGGEQRRGRRRQSRSRRRRSVGDEPPLAAAAEAQPASGGEGGEQRRGRGRSRRRRSSGKQPAAAEQEPSAASADAQPPSAGEGRRRRRRRSKQQRSSSEQPAAEAQPDGSTDAAKPPRRRRRRAGSAPAAAGKAAGAGTSSDAAASTHGERGTPRRRRRRGKKPASAEPAEA